MFTPLTQKKAWAVAKQFMPVIWQRWEGYKDAISPIYFGDYLPHLKPAVYFSAKQNDKWLAINYNIFHRYDWSEGQFGGVIRDKLDSHECDFEGCCVIVSKPTKKRRPDYLIYQAHADLKATENPISDGQRVILDIEPMGHGIHAPEYENECKYVKSNLMVYNDYKLINMESVKFQAWLPEIKRVFNDNHVNMPDQVNDWLVRRRHGKKTDGLIYTDPIKLLKYL